MGVGRGAAGAAWGSRRCCSNDDRLGRALEILAVYAETLRGTLAARAIERFGIDAGRLHVDLTALRVCGAYEHSALVAKGWAPRPGRRGARSARCRRDRRRRVSLYVRPEPGNAAEVSLIAQSLERLRELSGPGGLLILDSACGHPKTLCQIARSGLQFIVPLRAQTGFRERFSTDVGHDGAQRAALRLSSASESSRQSCAPVTAARSQTGRSQTLRPGETRRFRVAYIHSSEEQRETAAARERALSKAEEQLQRVQNGLGGRYYKTRKQVEKRVARIIAPNIEGLIRTTTATRNGKPTLTWTRDHEAIAAAGQTDGLYALATNLPGARLTAGQVLRHYKGQQIVERRHRDYKQTLKVRPIFLHNDDRIYALTSIIGIALLIFGLIETELRKALDADDELHPRPAARGPRRQANRTQRPRRLPRTRPHLHPRRHPTRPPHPHPTPHPRTAPDHTTLARAAAGRTSPFITVAVGTPVAKRPPRRSQRARLTHWAPALGGGGESLLGPGMQDAGLR